MRHFCKCTATKWHGFLEKFFDWNFDESGFLFRKLIAPINLTVSQNALRCKYINHPNICRKIIPMCRSGCPKGNINLANMTGNNLLPSSEISHLALQMHSIIGFGVDVRVTEFMIVHIYMLLTLRTLNKYLVGFLIIEQIVVMKCWYEIPWWIEWNRGDAQLFLAW